MSPRKIAKQAKKTGKTAKKKPAVKKALASKKTQAPKAQAKKASAKKAPAKKAPVKKAQAKKTAVKKAKASVALAKKQQVKVDPSRVRALNAAVAALEKKALDLIVLEMTELVSYADYFVICTGNSRPHVQAVADNVEAELRKTGAKPIGMEGASRGHWVLIDYGDVVVHVMDPDARQYYGLEKLWLDAPRVSIDADQAFVGGQDEGAVGCGCG